MIKGLIIFLSLILIIKAKFLDNLDRTFSSGDNKVLEVSITISDEDYNKIVECVQVSPMEVFQNNAKEHEAVANITITDNDKVKSFPGSKLKTSGNFSKSFTKPGFNIELSEKYKQRKIFRLRTDSSDVSHIRQKVVCDIANRVGLPSIQSTFVRLTINGKLFGLFGLMDSLKPYNIKRMYNTKTDKKDLKLIQCKDMGFRFTSDTVNICSSDGGDESAFEEFKQFVAEVEKANSLEDLEKIMNVDIFLKYFALEWVIGSFDHMLVLGHNFYFYKNEINNKWDVIYYDFDNTLGQAQRVDWAWSSGKNQGVEDYTTLTFEEFTDNQRIFDIAVNKDDTRFKKNLKELLTFGYNPVLLNEHIDDLKSYISPYVKEEYTPINGEYPGRLNKLGYPLDGLTYESYELNSEYGTVGHQEMMGELRVPGIKAWIRDSFESVCAQYGFDKEEILKDTVTLAPTSFFTKIKNGISPYDGSIIPNNNNDDDECWASEQGYDCCESCNVVFVEENGQKWGVENNQWCGIQDSVCEAEEDVCQSSDYGCCETCNQYYVDYTGRYGYENGQWCLVKNTC
ncbi:hypothetical protein BCR36DRAFT_364604 [Piromyces finnis]|uniref:CBM10 domain-containing protein n=1 Tax=Piromyces finnis TaxID=1754191 RepID=A0A1Y1UQR5_9FUNG|nr:hypothetical protein BCR36DRAFT_364604 [Piromyces finnis]|eukprot:ORX40428.1 hypothetical protein BCR36DRAFT_364604 [Piromyces finnis]